MAETTERSGLYARFIEWLVRIGRLFPLPKGIKETLINYEMVSYLFIGVCTTLVDYIVYWSVVFPLRGAFDSFAAWMVSLGVPASAVSIEMIGNVISNVIAILFAFVTNKLYVFESRTGGFGTVMKEFGIFTLGRLGGFALSQVFIFFTVTKFALMGKMVSKILSSVFVLILNYFISKFLVFTNKTSKGESKDV